MTAAQRREEDSIRDVPDAVDDNGSDSGDVFRAYEDDVLRGRLPADISHAGEDLTDEEVHIADRSLLDELRAHHKCVRRLFSFLFDF